MIVENGAFKIIGVLRLSDFHPAFALAVAVRGREPGYWLQVRGSETQRVIGFASLAEIDEADVEPLREMPIRVGSQYVYGFINRRGDRLLGTAESLRMELGIAMREPNTSMSIKLEIIEHVGNLQATKQMRAELTGALASTFGPRAATVFRDSAARARLWEIVESFAANPHALARIRSLRPRLVARTDNNSGILIDLSALDPGDVTISFEEVTARMEAEFGSGGRIERLRRVDLSGLSNIADPTGQTIIEAMTRSPRQEERLAILLRAMILNPEAAGRAMSRYEDPALMAAAAIGRFSAVIRTLPTTEEAERVDLFASEIKRTIRSAYPRRRGAMLYYFAEHLSDFPVLERLLRSIAVSSRARDVAALRPQILQALERKNNEATRFILSV